MHVLTHVPEPGGPGAGEGGGGRRGGGGLRGGRGGGGGRRGGGGERMLSGMGRGGRLTTGMGGKLMKNPATSNMVESIIFCERGETKHRHGARGEIRSRRSLRFR